MCRHSEDKQLPIGFCFSFPCTHTAIGEAIMVKLTKKFENDGLVGQDPAKGLQRALDRQKANVSSRYPWARLCSGICGCTLLTLQCRCFINPALVITSRGLAITSYIVGAIARWPPV